MEDRLFRVTVKNRKPSVLFLTPGASRVGGNIFLLNFLRWASEYSDLKFITLYGHGGDLEPEFQKLGPAFNLGYGSGDVSAVVKNLQRVDKLLGLHQARVIRALKRFDIGLIYSNAVINHDAMAALTDLDVPVVAHCHELETLIQKHGLDNFERLKKRSSHFVAVAEAVRDNLVERHGIDRSSVELLHEFIPIQELANSEADQRRSQTRADLGIPENAFVVGGSGTMYWRKAPDVFIQIAARLKRLIPNREIRFLWIGGARAGDAALIEARYDADKLGISDMIQFVEHLPDPTGHLAAIDVFALTSREDPYPLVCLEAASFAKPIVCFKDAGGMPEFVRNDAGFVVPFLDIDGFADRLFELGNSPELVSKLGSIAKKRVLKDHDVNVCGPKMISIIDRFLKE